MLATGSYDQTTAIYREDNMELLYVLHGQEGGVTHVSWIYCYSVLNYLQNLVCNFVRCPLLRSSFQKTETICILGEERYITYDVFSVIYSLIKKVNPYMLYHFLLFN